MKRNIFQVSGIIESQSYNFTNTVNFSMPSFYGISLFLVSAAHLGFGLGNLLKVPPYNPAVFLVDGKPGKGKKYINIDF